VTPPLAAFCAMTVIAGLLLILAGLEKVPANGQPKQRRGLPIVSQILGSQLPARARRRRRILLAVSFGAGVLAWLFTGWVLAVVVAPAAVLGVPALLRPPQSATDVELLAGIEQWTRGLAGVLTVGSGIEHAVVASLGSTPAAVKPQVSQLVSRINAGWSSEDALRAFADDLDDATGDLVAGSLILGVRRRGSGLPAVLEDLASTVAEEVRSRRAIEADRARPRTVARWVTIITLGVLAILINSSYMRPYHSGLGQVALAILLAAFVGCLLWMRRMTVGQATPRFLQAEEAIR
jgi:tight adherence protein B